MSDRHPLIDYRRDGPPKPPFAPTGRPPASDTPDAISILDARGLPYELLPELPGREGMRSAAAAIGSRLTHALGYRVAEVYVVRDDSGQRMAATRWPAGVDLGPTPINRLRADDPNDHLPHVDRRSLRALKLVTAWLDIPKMRPRMLRDVFVGKNAEGHVQHFLVGFEGSIGVEGYLRAVDFARDPDREDANFFLRLWSLGLSPKMPGILPTTEWPSIGLFSSRLVPADYEPSPPFEPIDRLQPGDLYWISKRMAAVPRATLAQAIWSAQLEPAPENYLFQVLHRRRATVAAWGYDQTTPCEVLGLDHDDESWALSLHDLAIAHRFITADERSYTLSFYDAEGTTIHPPITTPASSDTTRLALPTALLDHGYSVVRVLGERGGKPLSRALDVHFRSNDGKLRIAGLRH
jgi:hypothetical protein